MNLKQRLDQDLKTAMLAGDKIQTTSIRGLKSAILYEELAQGKRDIGLPDQEIVSLLQKEAKKRQESAELYEKGGSPERAAAERTEKRLIETYLPEQLSDEELSGLIDVTVKAVGLLSTQTMGQIISQVKQSGGGAVDGGRIARAVKDRLG